jgi:hypothetical protein
MEGGAPAPGLFAGTTLHAEDEGLSFNASGRMAGMLWLREASVPGLQDDSIWTNVSGSLEMLARQGGQAPGLPNGVTFGFMGGTAVSSGGHVTFAAQMFGRLDGGQPDSGIWLGTPGGVSLVAGIGDQAPGTASGVSFASFDWEDPIINASGQIAFNASLAGIGIDATNSDGIWVGDADSLSLYARSGEQAAGLPVGVRYRGFSSPAMNATGSVAFVSGLYGDVSPADESAVWSDASGSLAVIVREGELAPGTNGQRFAQFDGGSLMLNSAGQAVFGARLQGASEAQPGPYGLWVQDKTGALQLVALVGEEIEVGPGDVRTISSINFACCAGGEAR